MTTKFLEDGRLVNVLAEFDGGIVVEPHIAYDEDFTEAPAILGAPVVVGKVYDSPPIGIYHKEVLELRKAIEGLREELISVRREKEQAARELHELEEEAKKHPDVGTLLAFIRGGRSNGWFSKNNGAHL
jgi:hypothetical protein